MRHKIGENLTVELLVLNKEGQKVTVSMPACKIYNMRTEKYWSGYGWQDDEALISMRHIDDGVYNYNFVPTELGVYKIDAFEYMNNAHNTSFVSVERYGINDIGATEYLGEEITLKFLALDNNNILYNDGAIVSIYNNSNSKYYNGADWTASYAPIDMVNLGGGMYSYSFLVDHAGVYTIENITKDNKFSLSYPLRVVEKNKYEEELYNSKYSALVILTDRCIIDSTKILGEVVSKKKVGNLKLTFVQLKELLVAEENGWIYVISIKRNGAAIDKDIIKAIETPELPMSTFTSFFTEQNSVDDSTYEKIEDVVIEKNYDDSMLTTEENVDSAIDENFDEYFFNMIMGDFAEQDEYDVVEGIEDNSLEKEIAKEISEVIPENILDVQQPEYDLDDELISDIANDFKV